MGVANEGCTVTLRVETNINVDYNLKNAKYSPSMNHI